MTHTLRELERELIQATGQRLTRFGFSPRPKRQTFHRDIDGGRIAVHLSFIENELEFDATGDVAIRFDAVEDLVHRSNKLLSKKEKTQTFTLGAELGNLESGEPFRLTVSSRADVEGAVDSIMAKLDAVGFPYLERYSRPEMAYNLLSRDDREVWLHSPIHSERAKRACALLVAMGRHSEVPSLGAKKRSFLQSMNDPGATAFAKFLAELPSP